MLKITIDGLDRILKKLNSIINQIKGGISGALDNTGKIVVEQSRLYVPEDKKAQLKRDLQYEVDGNIVSIGVPIDASSGQYAHFIHYGRYNEGPITQMKTGAGRLFITRAIQEQKSEIIENFRKIIKV